MIKSLQQPQHLASVWGDITGDITCSCYLWFRKFRDGERSCQIHARSGHLSVITDEDLDTVVTNFQHPTIVKLAETFLVHRTIVVRLDVCVWPRYQARSVGTTLAYNKPTRRKDQHLYFFGFL